MLSLTILLSLHTSPVVGTVSFEWNIVIEIPGDTWTEFWNGPIHYNGTNLLVIDWWNNSIIVFDPDITTPLQNTTLDFELAPDEPFGGIRGFEITDDYIWTISATYGNPDISKLHVFDVDSYELVHSQGLYGAYDLAYWDEMDAFFVSYPSGTDKILVFNASLDFNLLGTFYMDGYRVLPYTLSFYNGSLLANDDRAGTFHYNVMVFDDGTMFGEPLYNQWYGLFSVSESYSGFGGTDFAMINNTACYMSNCYGDTTSEISLMLLTATEMDDSDTSTTTTTTTTSATTTTTTTTTSATTTTTTTDDSPFTNSDTRKTSTSSFTFTTDWPLFTGFVTLIAAVIFRNRTR